MINRLYILSETYFPVLLNINLSDSLFLFYFIFFSPTLFWASSIGLFFFISSSYIVLMIYFFNGLW